MNSKRIKFDAHGIERFRPDSTEVPCSVLIKVIRKWRSEIASVKADGKVYVVRERLPDEENPLSCDSKRYNLRNGGDLGPIANACGVNFVTLKRFLEGKTIRIDVRERIESTLIAQGRLDPLLDGLAAPIRPPPRRSDRRELRDRFQNLAIEVARWGGLQGRDFPEHGILPLDEEFRELAFLAETGVDVQEIAHATAILRGHYLGKAGYLVNHLPQSWEVVSQLSAVRSHPNAAQSGLAPVAAWVQCRLVRGLILSVPTAIDRLHWLTFARDAILSIDREREIPFDLPVPGLAAEANLEHRSVNLRSGHDATTSAIFIPRRYQAAAVLDSAYLRWELFKDLDAMRDGLSTATHIANEGIATAERWQNRDPVTRLRNMIFITTAAEIMLKSAIDGVDRTNTCEAKTMAACLDRTAAAQGGDRTDSDYVSRLHHCLLMTLKNGLVYSGKRLILELEKVTKVLKDVHAARPQQRGITFQEAAFRHVFLASSDREIRQLFLSSFGFSDAERREYQVQIVPEGRKSQRERRTTVEDFGR